MVDGTIIEVSVDGKRTQTDVAADGSKVVQVSETDGRRRSITRDAVLERSADGTITSTHKDGTWTKRKVDGTVMTRRPGPA